MRCEDDAAEWLEQLEAAGIPAGPINSISQALTDPQAVHRGVRLNVDGGALGPVPMVGCPIRLDGERSGVGPQLAIETAVMATCCGKGSERRN